MELNLNLDTDKKEKSESQSQSNSNSNSENLKEKEKEKEKNNIKKHDQNSLNRDMFEFMTVIGKGGFGKVWKVQYKKTKEYFALKEMSKRKILDKKSEKSINSEMKFLSILNHPFIVNMHYAFQDNDNLYLVIDLLSGGDLRYHCSRYRTFSEEQTRFFIACITYSLKYIHENNVIHRDIKPENLVLDDKGYLRVTDFGIAKYNTADNSSETSGTPGYMSPEVMNSENHSFTADFFAIGVIGFEFLMGYRPYNGKNRKEIKDKIFSEKVIIKPEQRQKGWSEDVIDFINKLLERDKTLRLGCNKGVEELKEHEWLKYYPWEELEQKILPAPFIPEQIDNFDKSYCESVEKITENTKLRYKKIFSSDAYQTAFVDFFFNKDIQKYVRKQKKSLKVKELNNKEEANDINSNNNDNKNINNENNINKEEILNLGNKEIKEENKNDNNNNNEKNEKSEKEIIQIKENVKPLMENKDKNDNKINPNSNNNNIINSNNKTEKEENISTKNIQMNSEGNPQKISENDNINNIISINSQNKQKEIPNYVNQYNTNNIIQINNFKKIIINHDDYIKKNKNDDFFLKEYIKYHNNKKQKKLSNKYNYILKVKKGNKYQPRKNSSLIFNSSKKDNNYIYNSEFIINNQFPKKEEQIQINTKNKTIFKHFMQNNNNNISRGNISNNLIVKNTNTIKYQKLRLKKRYNNSFRVNHIKNLYKGEKINTIKKIYLDHNRERNDNMSNRLEKNNFGRTYIYPKMSENYNTKLRKEIKSNDKKIPKIPIYMNNNMNNNNISSSNYYTGDISDNFDTNRLNNISNFKLNANNDINFKYSNSLNNISYKNKTFNFNRKVPKIKSLEKNKLFNTNIFNNKSRTNSNIKLKNFDRINSAGKFKSVGYKFDKVNGLNNNIKKTRIEKQGNKSNSNKKDKFQYFSLS